MDHILVLLQQDIDEYRMQAFENFGLEILVHPTSDAAEVYDDRGDPIGFDRYSFDPYSKEPRSMSVRLSRTGRARIRYRKQWRHVDSYLKWLKPSIDWNAKITGSRYETHRVRWEQQQRWWAANEKTFRFMDLPSEIREIIYGFAIGDRVEPYPTSRARRLGKGNVAMVARMPNASLLFTSKLVYQEARNILFRYTLFFVDRRGVLCRLLQNSKQSSQIRRLELALPHIEYFKLFGMECKDETVYEPQLVAHTLPKMQLDRLEIHFAAPSSTTSEDWLDRACQKRVVDWILDEAWPYIRAHPLKLNGYVKRSSRALFKARVTHEKDMIELWQRQRAAARESKGEISQYYAELDEEDGGVALDVEKATGDLVQRERGKLYSLACYCRRRCELKSWTSKD